MKRLLYFALVLFFLFFPSSVSAQVSGYRIENFDSKITINKDTSITVTETISANFARSKHGIFRVIPVTYSFSGKTLNTRLKDISITDEQGIPYKYEKGRLSQSINLKIGDPDILVMGEKTYVITYRVENAIAQYGDHDELYWNVVGSEWDTSILASSVTVTSDFADITNAKCFAGRVGTTLQDCVGEFDAKSADFGSNSILGTGKDFTVVLALDKNNQLAFPGTLKKISNFILDNWAYVIALFPLGAIFFFWYKKGRDIRFVGDNIYYEPADKTKKTAGLFERKYLPLVYYPINGLSPSEVGTIVDERVDIADIVSEIIELARLGYLKIKVIKKKKLIFKNTEYKFIKIEKDSSSLKDYQKFLLEKIFSEKDIIMLSEMKNHFYKHLKEFKEKLYENLNERRIFDGNPEKVRGKWLGLFILFEFLAFILVILFVTTTYNFGPLIVASILSVPGIFLAVKMPRRTAIGYSFNRQIEGLKWYLKKGKWRLEVAEMHIFLEEMLPLAISLGVVDKLTKDMSALGVNPPSYFVNTNAALFASDFNAFQTSSTSSLLSAPGGGWSGASSWSGGSGFSGGGGSSGGGMGGGGGGGW